MIEPTAEQCSSNARVEQDGKRLFAAWYPQMGGYVGRCWIELCGGCFEVYIWHDGEFPISGGNPTILHHCDAEQFIRFGETVRRLEQQ